MRAVKEKLASKVWHHLLWQSRHRSLRNIQNEKLPCKSITVPDPRSA
jgi:hypothetical protein